MTVAERSKLKLLFAAPEFFSTKPTKLAVETNEGTGRTYFLKSGRIVAVGAEEGEAADAKA